MNGTKCSGWLGYALDRARGEVGVGDLGDRVLLLGRRAGDIATLLAFAYAEAGTKIVILDIDGSISPDVHGYFRTFDYRSMLYEAFHLDGDDATHGQLVAAAYAAALDLTSEEEAILSSALQKLSEQNDMATPSALYDVLGGVEGFRGYYVDKLKGRIGSLKLMETTHVEGFDELIGGGALVSFASAPYPQAAELASGLYVAKILHLLAVSEALPDAILITGASRLFRNLTRYQHSGRLMGHLLEITIPLILASPLPALLNDRIVESMPVRIYSSDAWNARKSWKQAAALSSSYTVCDDRSGTSRGFVTRFIKTKRASTPVFRSASTNRPNPELTRTILEEISRFDSANRQSVVSYLTPLFLAADVGVAIDRLHSDGHLILEPKEVGSGPRILAYTVTESGRRLLEGLRK
ncbi:MAG: hypothetical protein OK452_09840 [Thaumarchaeota archaeon]|nr:hypothetical protein [Nitrososphaerota archaeon]